MNHLLFPLLFLVAVVATPAQACLNEYRPNTAAVERSHSVFALLVEHAEKERWDVRRDRLRKELAAGGNYRVKNDLATALAHTGQAVEAVTLLEQIEAEKPGLYRTASNLGTVYELAGNNQKALEWIRRGIERNPEAHEGTEWLHVRILEAKLALSNAPKWLESNSILGRDKNSKSVRFSATGNRGEKLSVDQVKAALIHQLHERLQFVNPPDAIVGALLLELGDLVGRESPGIGGAMDVFKLAYSYLHGLPNVSSLEKDAARKFSIADEGQQTPSAVAPVTFNIIIGVLISFLVIYLKRRIQLGWAGNRAPGAA